MWVTRGIVDTCGFVLIPELVSCPVSDDLLSAGMHASCKILCVSNPIAAEQLLCRCDGRRLLRLPQVSSRSAAVVFDLLALGSSPALDRCLASVFGSAAAAPAAEPQGGSLPLAVKSGGHAAAAGRTGAGSTGAGGVARAASAAAGPDCAAGDDGCRPADGHVSRQDFVVCPAEVTVDRKAPSAFPPMVPKPASRPTATEGAGSSGSSTSTSVPQSAVQGQEQGQAAAAHPDPRQNFSATASELGAMPQVTQLVATDHGLPYPAPAASSPGVELEPTATAAAAAAAAGEEAAGGRGAVLVVGVGVREDLRQAARTHPALTALQPPPRLLDLRSPWRALRAAQVSCLLDYYVCCQSLLRQHRHYSVHLCHE